MDCAGIALVDDFDVVRKLCEVCVECVEDGLSLRRGGHRECVAPVERVGLTRRVGVLEGWRSEARGRASRPRGGVGGGGMVGAGSHA